MIEQSASFLGTHGTFHGHEGLLRSAREMFELFQQIYFVPAELIELGEDRVLAFVEAHVRGRESGAEIERPVFHLWTLRAGRVVGWRVIFDRDEALAAAGIRAGDLP